MFLLSLVKVGGFVARDKLISITANLDFVYSLFGILLEPFGPSVCQLAITMLDDILVIGPFRVFDLINIDLRFFDLRFFDFRFFDFRFFDFFSKDIFLKAFF